MFWGVACLMAIVVLARLVMPLLRPPKQPEDRRDVDFYKAQLAEVDRDVARGVMAAEEADRTKTEIARRLLAAAEASTKTIPAPPPRIAAGAVAVLALGMAFAGYGLIGAQGLPDMPLKMRMTEAETIRTNRPTQTAAETAARVPVSEDFPEDYLASVQRLRDLMPERENDLKGWELLAYHEARLRNFPAAADAQAKVIEIKGDAVVHDDLIRHADLLVAATDGYVSPEAESSVRNALALEPNSVAARYYLGSMFDQTGRPDLAFRLWRPILESGLPENVYGSLVRSQIARTAFFAGVNYDVPTIQPVADLPGPSAEMMAAARDMPAEDRMAMIENMVSGLAARLATEGGSAAEWARLINAYGVLGRVEEAKSILSEARAAFQTSVEAQALLDEAGKALNASE